MFFCSFFFFGSINFGGKCSGGKCPEGKCPGGKCLGGYYPQPQSATTALVTHHHWSVIIASCAAQFVEIMFAALCKIHSRTKNIDNKVITLSVLK